MGQQGPATCRTCGHGFRVSTGGGYISQIVFCMDCGHGENVFHNQQVLGGDDPEAVIGTCPRCSGQLRMNAAPRCPQCCSVEVELGSMDLRWD